MTPQMGKFRNSDVWICSPIPTAGWRGGRYLKGGWSENPRGFIPPCSRDLAQTRWACPSRAPPCAPALVKTRLRYVCREGLGIEPGWFGMFWEKWLCSSPSTLNTGGAGLRQVKRPWLCNGFFSTEPLLHPTLDSDKTWITYELPF